MGAQGGQTQATTAIAPPGARLAQTAEKLTGSTAGSTGSAVGPIRLPGNEIAKVGRLVISGAGMA